MVTWIIEKGDYAPFRISDLACQLIEDSWRRQDKNLYGRFDLAWNGQGAPKMLEYNADTPTALYEASVVQWEWLDSYCAHCDQRSEEHTSELQSLMRITYAVFCLKKKTQQQKEIS